MFVNLVLAIHLHLRLREVVVATRVGFLLRTQSRVAEFHSRSLTFSKSRWYAPCTMACHYCYFVVFVPAYSSMCASSAVLVVNVHLPQDSTDPKALFAILVGANSSLSRRHDMHYALSAVVVITIIVAVYVSLVFFLIHVPIALVKLLAHRTPRICCPVQGAPVFESRRR